MSKSALKSVKVILWAEVHKSQNAKLISIPLKNTKHEGNHKLFILPKRKWLHRILERIYEEGHQLMTKFLQQSVTTDINLWNKKTRTNYIYFRRVNTSAYWSTQNGQREQKQWRKSWDTAFTILCFPRVSCSNPPPSHPFLSISLHFIFLRIFHLRISSS